jgi:hypothetical protein
MTQDAFNFILWCCVGIALCSVLQQIEGWRNDVKAERLEEWKRKPLETVEAVDPSPESLSASRTDIPHTRTPTQSF